MALINQRAALLLYGYEIKRVSIDIMIKKILAMSMSVAQYEGETHAEHEPGIKRLLSSSITQLDHFARKSGRR